MNTHIIHNIIIQLNLSLNEYRKLLLIFGSKRLIQLAAEYILNNNNIKRQLLEIDCLAIKYKNEWYMNDNITSYEPARCEKCKYGYIPINNKMWCNSCLDEWLSEDI